MSRTFGIDVSHYQGTVNWKQTVLAGARFVFIKCCENRFLDSFFVQHWQNAKAAGILRGRYCFGNYNSYAAPQAEYFVSQLPEDMGELPPVLDVEQVYKRVYNADTNQYESVVMPLPPRLNLLKWIEEFMIKVYQMTGKRAILYTNPATIKHMSPIPTDMLIHDLWLAHYLNPLSIAAGWQPTFKPWAGYRFWQYTAKEDGTKYGTTSKSVDGNFFNGDYDQLVAYSKSFTGGGQPQPDKTIIDRVAALEKEARLRGWNV